MTRGDIYRTRERIVSQRLIVENEDVSTVICAPVYSEILGLVTEVVVGPEDGLPRPDLPVPA